MLSKSLRLLPYVIPRSGVVSGPKTGEYERAFAEKIGAAAVVGFWKGRLGFYAALKALGVGEGDDVVMPGYTCLVVPAAVTYLGANPVYIDIEPATCTLDPDLLEESLTPRTKALMIQHTYGWPSAALSRVLEVAREKSIPVIEDCCHALGTSVDGRHVGTFGIAGFFSSQWSKPYTTGLGGMLTCNDCAFHEKVLCVREEESLYPTAKTAAQLAIQNIIFETFVFPTTMSIARRSYRWLSSQSIITGSTSKGEYIGRRDRYFQRMSEVQATAGLSELSRYDRALEHRRMLTDYYMKALPETGMPVPPIPEGAEVTALRFPVRVKNKQAALHAAEKACVELGDWFLQPLHSTMARQEDFGYHIGMCPKADRAAREIVNLPTHARVSLSHARRAVRLIESHALKN